MRLSELPANFLPSRILAGHVYLIGAGQDRFPEPLYQISLARLFEQDQPVTVRLPLKILSALVQLEGLPGPGGLIFHTGRCGSTLLANMLGAHPAVRMIKEPEALNQVLLDREPTAAIAAVLRAFGRGLARGAMLVVKCTTWNIAEQRQLLTTFPQARAIFLWRPAAEVVASCLDTPAPWGSPHDHPWLLGRLIPDGPARRPDPVALYGHAWRAAAQAALQAREEFGDRVKVISYAELRADPGKAAVASARHLALPVTPDLAASMAQHAAMYSKDPAVRFAPAGVHARRPLTATQADLVERMTRDVEGELARGRAAIRAAP